MYIVFFVRTIRGRRYYQINCIGMYFMHLMYTIAKNGDYFLRLCFFDFVWSVPVSQSTISKYGNANM